MITQIPNVFPVQIFHLERLVWQAGGGGNTLVPSIKVEPDPAPPAFARLPR